MKPDYVPNNWMETYTGKKFYIKSPRLQDIDIIDIAHSLALQCRFRGHCRTFYSVAEHSIRVADILPPELRLAGLLHDAAEAYVGDMIRGQKESIPSFRKVEKDILDLIYIKFTVPTKLIGNRWIKEADDILTATEGRDLMSNIDDWISELGVRPLDSAIEPYDWRVAEQLFLISFDILKGGKHEKR